VRNERRPTYDVDAEGRHFAENVADSWTAGGSVAQAPDRASTSAFDREHRRVSPADVAIVGERRYSPQPETNKFLHSNYEREKQTWRTS
jgi:hypothetical protein